MDVNTAGSLALLSYQSALQSSSQAQALQQAFKTISVTSSEVAALPGSSDAALLTLSSQPSTNLATYQLAAQTGSASSSIQSLLASTTNPDLLLAASINSGSQAFPVVDPTTAAAWSSFQYDQTVGTDQSGAYAQQLAASAAQAASSSVLNLLA